eukprot:TRINITY_DN6171_c0_g1_i2.p1 TRINITY_DN6171_c0_g1~~TRINITY_DN6171_c0_g1_i2.p1  ORF type:complete len:121 (+),score=22.03 TRINITY_DN6171_c0_g1_i2:98-460(+)
MGAIKMRFKIFGVLILVCFFITLALSSNNAEDDYDTVSEHGHDEAQKEFDRIDVDGDGYLSMQELDEYTRSGNPEMVKEFMHSVDQNGDGVISLEEFRMVASQQEGGEDEQGDYQGHDEI